MIKDITLGQYFPGESVIHRVDPRFKLILTLIFIVMVFTASTPAGYAVVFAFLSYVIIASRISLKLVIRSLRPIFIFMLFTAVLNVLYVKGGTVLVHWKFIN